MFARTDRETKTSDVSEKGSITLKGFTKAITKLQEAWSQVDKEGTGGWQDVKMLNDGLGAHFLRISAIKAPRSANLPVGHQAEIEGALDVPELDDGDDEALIRPVVNPQELHGSLAGPVTVRYDIIFSPTYRVPTLYISPQSAPGGRSLTLDEIYAILVPQHHHAGMKSVSVMGGLTMIEHPVSGMTCWFVHPCRTVEALASLVGTAEVGEVEYLMLWLGVIGASVGLEVPVALAPEMVSK